MEARRYSIEGKVQGVGFRWSARETALSLGLRGWVMNDTRGGVSCHVQGDIEALARFDTWIKRGPPGARVVGCDVSETTVDPSAKDFVILREDD